MRTTLKSYQDIAHLPHARRLLAADAISKAGDWVLYVAMSFLIFRAGGAGALALFSALRIVVPFVLGPWAGHMGASIRPRTLMIMADVARAALLICAAAAAHTGQSAWVLVALVVGCAMLSAFHAPAERRLQRDVVTPDQRAAFNAVIGSSATTVIVVAPVLGGLLTTLVGNVGALLVDAASFLLSAVLVATVRRAEVTASEPPSADPATATGPRGGALSAALRAATSDPVVLACVITQAAACTIAGASLVLVPILAGHLGAGGAAIGWLTAAIGVGSVLGVLIGGGVARNERVLLCVVSIIAMGPMLGLLGSSPNLLVALVCGVAIGLAANVPEPMYWTSYGNRVNEADSSSLYGLVESAITGGFALGGVVVGALVAALGITVGTWVLGALGTAAAATALIPALRHHRAQPSADRSSAGSAAVGQAS
ncbi:MFS transporter [Nocardia sp. NPDC052254]|uniref:MFS transporter n=1 Tax=Nocardia sp. NPDC052254 TaxID=3155681 RepID=UPI003427B50F